MKTFLLLLVGLTACKLVCAQLSSQEIDSLKRVVKTTKNEKEKLDALTLLADNYSAIPDSEFHYGTLARETAIKVNDKDAEAYAIGDISQSLFNNGNYVQALDLDFKILKTFQELKDSAHIANTYNGIAHIYRVQSNYQLAKAYFLKGLQLASLIKDYKDMYFNANGLSRTYNNLGQFDSALYTAQLALNIINSKQYKYSRTTALWNLSGVYANLHKDSLSEQYLKDALETATRENDQYLRLIQTAYASALLGKNKPDLALLYATKAKKSIDKDGTLMSKFTVNKLLAQIYESKKQYEQAYEYQNKALQLNDSLSSTTQIQQIANLTFNKHQQEIDLKNVEIAYQNRLKLYGALGILAFAVISVFFLFSRNKKQQKANRLLQQQKQQIQETLGELKSTQSQLIQSEKMASLGELTAGIAHEIQNPLNFVNNFSEVNKEILQELKSEKSKVKSERNDQLEEELLAAIAANEEKINHHGKRADAIVKSMLQHSRASGGQKEPTDINVLVDEYLRLAYQGQRAKDKSFNVKLLTDFDPSIGKINIIPQDIGRVMLNLFNNAFYAAPLPPEGGYRENTHKHEPTVWVSTRKVGNNVLVSVKDNGPGIPQKILDKIFQPFFTTKPTGQGTGLGLSLSYDIIKAHGGEIKVETKEGEGTEFIIRLPS